MHWKGGKIIFTCNGNRSSIIEDDIATFWPFLIFFLRNVSVFYVLHEFKFSKHASFGKSKFPIINLWVINLSWTRNIPFKSRTFARIDSLDLIWVVQTFVQGDRSAGRSKRLGHLSDRLRQVPSGHVRLDGTDDTEMTNKPSVFPLFTVVRWFNPHSLRMTLNSEQQQ